MTSEQLAQVARSSLLPLDLALADLLDKSLRMDAARFAREVERAVEEVPLLMQAVDIDAVAEPLELEVGRAMIEGIKDGRYKSMSRADCRGDQTWGGIQVDHQ